MSNESIRSAFESGNGKAFIPFITCGDPDLETTKALVFALQDAGADIIELGVPFSDPTAEGPVIQGANLRALSGGVTTDAIFDMVAEIRSDVRIPLVFMTYGNIVYHYGIERFCERAEDVGISGLILPDTPYEEKDEFAPACARHGIAYVSLIAPTSAERVAMIAAEAQGFVYCVSSLGVTGTRDAITTDIDALVARVRAATDAPVAVGFGISTPEQAATMAAKSDGAIVGSALVKLVAEHGAAAAAPVAERARALAEAVHAL
ncbi:MAG: tryptophan synthase subunit alpha [Eggerthellaceae bacterium]|nr:tryptophan synthase subunit alpha [Eggerthellaceae bacterium]